MPVIESRINPRPQEFQDNARVMRTLVDDLRERMIANLDEMQQMVEATLTFAREDAAKEATETRLTQIRRPSA